MVIEMSVNYVSVLVATIVSFIVGFLWYGPLFGKAWMKLNKISKKDIAKAQKDGIGSKMVLCLIGTFITAYVLSVVISNLGLVLMSEVIMLSLILGIGLISMTTILGSVLWDNKSWGLFLFNSIYWIINIEIISIVINLMG